MTRKYFRIADRVSIDEARKLGIKWPQCNSPWRRFGDIAMAERTNEFRPPRKGEWYLSGASPAAYKAPNDLSQAFRIMRLVGIRREQKVVETRIENMS